MARNPRKAAGAKPAAKKAVAKKTPAKKTAAKKAVSKKAAISKVDTESEMSHKDMESVIKMETQSLNRVDMSEPEAENTIGKTETKEAMVRIKILIGAWGYSQGEEHILPMSEAKELMQRNIAMRMIMGGE